MDRKRHNIAVLFGLLAMLLLVGGFVIRDRETSKAQDDNRVAALAASLRGAPIPDETDADHGLSLVLFVAGGFFALSTVIVASTAPREGHNLNASSR